MIVEIVHREADRRLLASLEHCMKFPNLLPANARGKPDAEMVLCLIADEPEPGLFGANARKNFQRLRDLAIERAQMAAVRAIDSCREASAYNSGLEGFMEIPIRIIVALDELYDRAASDEDLELAVTR